MRQAVKSVSDDVHYVQKSTQMSLNLPQGQLIDIEEKDTTSLEFELDLRKQCSRLHRQVRKSTGFARFIKEMDLSKMRPLTTMKRVPIRCDKNYVKDVVIPYQNASMNLYQIKMHKKEFNMKSCHSLQNNITSTKSLRFLTPKSIAQKRIGLSRLVDGHVPTPSGRVRDKKISKVFSTVLNFCS